MKRYGLTVFILALILQVSPSTHAATITTPGIVAQTTAATLTCMRWTPVGMCFWLRCSWTGCRVRTSLKIGHYNPDLVVSVYNELGGNPWAEIRATLGLAQKVATTGLLGALLPIPVGSAGNRTEGTSGRDHKNLAYRETDAIGHPLSSMSGVVAGIGLVCPSQTAPLLPPSVLAFSMHPAMFNRPKLRTSRTVWLPTLKNPGAVSTTESGL